MHTNGSLSLPWFLPVFVSFWLFLSAFIARVGGWRRLSARFRARGSYKVRVHRFQSCRMRYACHYGGCINVGANRDGLSIAVFPLFRFCHPPLFIPWSEIAVLLEMQGLFFAKQKFLLGSEAKIPWQVSKRLAGKLLEARDGTV